MRCQKCKNILFKIQIIPCCDDCSENRAWDSDVGEYVSDENVIVEKELTRNEVSEEGECSYGSAWGRGCYMFTCAECGAKRNLAMAEGC